MRKFLTVKINDISSSLLQSSNYEQSLKFDISNNSNNKHHIKVINFGDDISSNATISKILHNRVYRFIKQFNKLLFIWK